MDSNTPWWFWLIPAVPAIIVALIVLGIAFGLGWLLGTKG